MAGQLISRRRIVSTFHFAEPFQPPQVKLGKCELPQAPREQLSSLRNNLQVECSHSIDNEAEVKRGIAIFI